MLPVGQGKGQIWRSGELLCEVKYDIGEPIRRTGALRVQRILLTLEDEHCQLLVDVYGLILVMANGSQHAILRPFQLHGIGHLECYVETCS
jgi:hypothetical protein